MTSLEEKKSKHNELPYVFSILKMIKLDHTRWNNVAIINFSLNIFPPKTKEKKFGENYIIAAILKHTYQFYCQWKLSSDELHPP